MVTPFDDRWSTFRWSLLHSRSRRDMWGERCSILYGVCKSYTHYVSMQNPPIPSLTCGSLSDGVCSTLVRTSGCCHHTATLSTRFAGTRVCLARRLWSWSAWKTRGSYENQRFVSESIFIWEKWNYKISKNISVILRIFWEAEAHTRTQRRVVNGAL